MSSLDLNVRCKPNGAIIFDEKEGKQKELGYVPFMPYYRKWKSDYHSNDGDGFDGTSCSLTIDSIDEETVTIDQPESAPNGVAEAHELLMLESAPRPTFKWQELREHYTKPLLQQQSTMLWPVRIIQFICILLLSIMVRTWSYQSIMKSSQAALIIIAH